MNLNRLSTLISIVAIIFAGCSISHDGDSSIEALVKKVQSSFEAKDGRGLLNLFSFSGTPDEVRSAFEGQILSHWGKGSWAETHVDTFRFSDYVPTTDVPGEFNGRQLTWVSQPSYWIVLNAKAPDGQGVVKNASATFEMAVFSKESRWFLVGVKYADQNSTP
jgi:hypothetical protein